MALRRHRLPRFWLGLTLGLVTALVGGAYWWERQLPQRLEQALSRGDLDACLRYGGQLEALRRPGSRIAAAQAQCRRAKAAELWRQERWAEALQLQLQLVNTPTASAGDRERLLAWQRELQQLALVAYQGGQLERALQLLGAMGEAGRSDGSGLGDQLREAWNRNRLLSERADKLADQQRWWEALDALTRIDHPWWTQRSAATSQRVKAGIASLEGQEREHDAHGSLPHTVPAAQLDALVQQRIAAGQNEWSAFQSACRSLGGRVVEAGPESACQR